MEIDEQKEGIILRASNLGGLEALIKLFRGIPIKRAKIGAPTKEDIVALEDVSRENKVLICFNVENPFEDLARDKNIKVIRGNVIYKLYEEFLEWQEKINKEKEEERKRKMKKIAKIRLLPGYVFRQSNPAIVGIEVLEGTLVSESRLMNKEGKILGEVLQIQKEGETIKELEKEDKAAISISKVTIGRQVKEGEILYTFITKEEYRELKSYEEVNKELLEEIRKILGYL
jgi:translation initiation factor 5B